jgi:hypothetical protein
MARTTATWARLLWLAMIPWLPVACVTAGAQVLTPADGIFDLGGLLQAVLAALGVPGAVAASAIAGGMAVCRYVSRGEPMKIVFALARREFVIELRENPDNEPTVIERVVRAR